MYDLGAPADDTIFPAIWFLPLLTHIWEPAGTTLPYVCSCTEIAACLCIPCLLS